MPLTPANVLNRVMEDVVPDLRLTNARFLNNLLDAGRARSYRKTTIDWVVGAGGETSQWESVTVDAGASTQGDSVPATLPIGNFRLSHRFTVSRIAMQEAAAIAPEDLSNLFGESVRTALISLMRRLNQALLTGDGTAASGQVVGLSQVATAANYAGIATAIVPAWAAVRNTNASPRALTRNLLIDFDVAIANAETMYDMVMTSANMVGTYTKVFDALAGGGVLAASDERLPKRLDLGHGNAYYNGYPIIQETMMANDLIYFMDSSQFVLNFFELANAPGGEGLSLGSSAVNNSMGFPVHIQELAIQNPSARTFVLHVYPQLQVRSRKALQLIDQLLP
jgi:hypothetical protein